MEKKTEIYPGMTTEEMTAVFFDRDALREPSYKVYQLNSDGHRYYYRFEGDEPKFYPSVTTMLSQVMPTSPGLLDWYASLGKEAANEKRDTAAAYGTLMHAEFEALILNRVYDFDNVPQIVYDYLRRENLQESLLNEWCIRLRKDVLSFAQFILDYDVRPLAIEIGLVHPEHHYAGCVDMPCTMVDAKGGERFAAIVDFKSGRKGFYEDYEIQLHLYKDMWNVNFPDMPIERVFNFAPKDWRKSPTYTLKEQTGSINAQKIPYLLSLAAIEDEKRDKVLTIVRGSFSLDNGNPDDNVLVLSLADVIKSRIAEKTPKSGEITEDNPSGV